MLYETISKDMVNAMKSKDKDTLGTLRLLKSAIDLYLVNNKNEFMFCYVDGEDVVEISNIDEYDMIIPLLANEAIKYLNENKKGN